MKGENIMGNEVQKVSTVSFAPKFMKAYDVSTASQEDALKIGDFLTNKETRKLREQELSAYLLKCVKQNGEAYTQDEAEMFAQYQVKNEMSQANSKITVPFIDKDAYEQAVKENLCGLYNYTLITDEELLSKINGDKIVDEAKKIENYKKYFKTDENGELVKDNNGKYIFDGDKFKAEFVQDVGTDYKLQLSEREEHAKIRGISKTAEKNAIKATGLDYRHDRTWLYRGLAACTGVASLVFGGAVAHAASSASSGACCADAAAAGATATNRTGQIIGGAVAFASIPFIKDTYDGHKRPDAAKAFEEAEPTVKMTIPEVEMPKVSLVTPTELGKIELREEKPCYDIQESGTPVKTINYGGYWHYANLYNDCKTGKKITGKELQELTRLLKPGHEDSSIQVTQTQVQGRNGKMRTVNKRVLQNEITLSNGTVVCLASSDVINARIAQMEADLAKKSHNGGAFKNDVRSINVCDCTSRKRIGSAKTREDAERIGAEYQRNNTRVSVVRK